MTFIIYSSRPVCLLLCVAPVTFAQQPMSDEKYLELYHGWTANFDKTAVEGRTILHDGQWRYKLGEEAHLHISLYKEELRKRPAVIIILEKNPALVKAAQAAGIPTPRTEYSKEKAEQWIKLLEAIERKAKSR